MPIHLHVTSLAACLLAVATIARGAPAASAPATQPTTASTASVLRLWEGDAPESQGSQQTLDPKNDVPTITVYAAPEGHNNGAALVVCPGGGYGHLADHEGRPVAEWFNTLGGTGIVLRYRLGPKYHHPAEMHDVQRALRLTRAHAKEWGIDPGRIGVLGFSAGGHLASTAATHFDAGDDAAKDPVDRLSCRPDFAVLVYPVITFHPPYGHGGSRRSLLGDNPDEQLVDSLSNDREVTEKTPPTYLVHASDDRGVPIENSLMFAAALSAHKVPWAMRIFDHGGHGFGMGRDDELKTWPQSCGEWLAGRGVFKATSAK